MKPRIICHVMTSVDGQIGAVPFRKTYRNAVADDALETYDDIDRSLFTDAWTLGKSIVTEIFPDKFSILQPANTTKKKTSLWGTAAATWANESRNGCSSRLTRSRRLSIRAHISRATTLWRYSTHRPQLRAI